MKTNIIKTVIIFTSLLYCDAVISDSTVRKCVDKEGAITFAKHCAPHQHSTDTGIQIDSRTEEQKTNDDANIKKHLDDLHEKSKVTPTVAPQTQPNLPYTELTPTPISNQYDSSYECLSMTRYCMGYYRPGLTQAQKSNILNKEKAVQLPARIKRR